MHFFLPLLAVIVLSGCQPETAPQGGGFPGTDGPPPKVTVVLPEQRSVQEWDDVTGKFVAIDTAEIRPRVSGHLKKIHFADGQIVKKGDLLYTIDPTSFQNTQQEAQANTNLAQTQLKLAEQQLARAQDLLSTGDVSQTFYDERLQERDQANEALRAAKARATNTAVDVGYTQVRAPITGRISRSRVDEGNLVQGDQMGQPTLLTTVVSLDPIHFYFTIDEKTYLKYARLAEAGERKSSRTTANPVKIALADETEYSTDGEMDFVDNALNAGSATMEGRAIVSNANNLIIPGMFGRGRIIGSGAYKALLVPPQAIATDQDRKLVMTVMEDGSVVPKLVQLGAVIDGLQTITGGLDGTEKIVTNGLQRSYPGMKVDAEVKTIAEVMAPPVPQQGTAQ